MKIGWKAAGAAAVVAAGAAAQAQAQTPEDIRRLDRLAMERAMRQPVIPARLPPLGGRPPEQPRPLRGLWECAGTEPGLPIHTEPSRSSPARGITQDHIAASRSVQDGFRMVMDYRGNIGFVPGSTLGPYRSPVREGVQCTVEGLRRDGSPVFGYR